MNGKTLLPCRVPGVASQGRKVKNMCKTLAGQETYFWTLLILGISTVPINTVPEHMGIIHAFANLEMRNEGCPNSLDEEQQQRQVCLLGGCSYTQSLAGIWVHHAAHSSRSWGYRFWTPLLP